MLAHIEAIARCSKPALGKSVVRALNAQQRYKGTLQKPVKSQADMVKELAKYIGGREQDKEGFFVRKPSYTEKDFQNSSFVKYMKQVDREGLQLVQEKLQLLAKTSGIPVDQLQRKLTDKVNQRLDVIKDANAGVLGTIGDFRKKLGSIAESKSGVVDDILASLQNYGEQFEQSELFQFLENVDKKFADLVAQTVKAGDKSPETVEKLRDYADKDSPISRLSPAQVGVLANLVHYGRAEVEETGSRFGSPEMRKFTQEREKNIKDTTQLVKTMLAHFNAAPTLESSPLYKLFRKIDFKFSELVSSYSKIDSEDKEALEKFLQRIVEYAANKATPLRTVLDDKTSEMYRKFQDLAHAPLPIGLGDIYKCLEARGDVFGSPVFRQMQQIDPEFAGLLEQLEKAETAEKASALDKQIEEYLGDEQHAICRALEDVKSESYRLLHAAVAGELRLMDRRVPVKTLVDVLVQKGAKSGEFQLVSSIDPAFGRVLGSLLTEQSGESDRDAAMAKLESIVGDPESAIHRALNEVDDENWKRLIEAIQPAEVAPEAGVAAGDAGGDAELLESERNRDKLEMQKFKEEDQSGLDASVAGINNAYELVLQALDNLTREIRDNQLDPVGPSVVERVTKLLRLNPSDEQKQEAREILDTPLPSHKDEVLELCVNLIMKDGKKDQARKFINRALYLIYLKTRADPVDVLKSALDTAAPLVITKTVKTGFAKNYIVPVPLSSRQRNRMAFLWILDSSDSRASNDFSVRLAEEILNVNDGNSRIMEKKALSHKLAIANRSYLRI